MEQEIEVIIPSRLQFTPETTLFLETAKTIWPWIVFPEGSPNIIGEAGLDAQFLWIKIFMVNSPGFLVFHPLRVVRADNDDQRSTLSFSESFRLHDKTLKRKDRSNTIEERRQKSLHAGNLVPSNHSSLVFHVVFASPTKQVFLGFSRGMNWGKEKVCSIIR